MIRPQKLRQEFSSHQEAGTSSLSFKHSGLNTRPGDCFRKPKAAILDARSFSINCLPMNNLGRTTPAFYSPASHLSTKVILASSPCRAK
jgi:hypothetical protein